MPTYEKFRKNDGVRCIRWGYVFHKLRARYHTLAYAGEHCHSSQEVVKAAGSVLFYFCFRRSGLFFVLKKNHQCHRSTSGFVAHTMRTFKTVKHKNTQRCEISVYHRQVEAKSTTKQIKTS